MASMLKSDNLGKLLLRIAVGGLLIFHGIFKVTHGIGFIEGMLAGRGWPGYIAYGVYVAEILAPILIIIGLRTRLVALVVAIDMVMAIWLAHAASVFAVKEAGGAWAIEIEVFYLVASLALFFTGGGQYSVSKGQGVWD
jgi:putative oxidoreductase